MKQAFQITENHERNLLVLTICGPIESGVVRQIRLALANSLPGFGSPITLIADLREAHGSHLDALEELRQLYREMEQGGVEQLVRIHANEKEDHGASITDAFHLKRVRKRRAFSMAEALRLCQTRSASPQIAEPA